MKNRRVTKSKYKLSNKKMRDQAVSDYEDDHSELKLPFREWDSSWDDIHDENPYEWKYYPYRETKDYIYIFKIGLDGDEWIEKHKRIDVGDFIYYFGEEYDEDKIDWLVLYDYRGENEEIVIQDFEPNNGYPVKALGENVFKNNKRIKKVVIPSGFREIPRGAFVNCINLEEVVLPNELTSIGDYAFRGCENLKNVVLPNELTSIGDFAFWDCKALKRLTLPETIKSIGYRAFDCDGDIIVDFPWKKIDMDGFIFGANKKWLKRNSKEIYGGMYLGTNLVGVVNNDIKYIKIPKECNYIYTDELIRCNKLETIEFEDGFDGLFKNDDYLSYYDTDKSIFWNFTEGSFLRLKEIKTGNILNSKVAFDIITLIFQHNLVNSLSIKLFSISEKLDEKILNYFIKLAREKEDAAMLSKLLEIHHKRFGGRGGRIEEI